MYVVKTDIPATQPGQASVKTLQRGTLLSIKPTSATGETGVNWDQQCPGLTGNIPIAIGCTKPCHFYKAIQAIYDKVRMHTGRYCTLLIW